MALSRRSFLTSTAAVTGVTALAACGAPGSSESAAPATKFGEPVTVTFWHTQTAANATALDEMVAKFNQTNGKNITLKSEYQGSYNQVFQKAMAAIQAGQTPDKLVAYESMVAEYMKANSGVNLHDGYQKGLLALTMQIIADIFPAYIDSNKYDAFNGKLLSYSFTKSLAVIYFNDDMSLVAGITMLTGFT